MNPVHIKDTSKESLIRKGKLLNEVLITLNREGEVIRSFGDTGLLMNKEEPIIGKIFLDLFPAKLSRMIRNLLKQAKENNLSEMLMQSANLSSDIYWTCHWSHLTEDYDLIGATYEDPSSEKDHIDRSLFNNSPLPNIIYNLNTFDICSVNQQATDIFGYSEEELNQMNMAALRPKEEIATLKEKHAELSESTEVMSFGVCTFINKQNETMRMDVTGIRLQYEGQACMLTTYKDITENEKKEQQVRISEERLRALNDSLTNYLIRVDLEGKYTYANKKFLSDFSREEDDVIGHPATNFIMNYHWSKLESVVSKCLRDPENVYKIELDKPNARGEIVETAWDFICLLDENQKPSEIQCIGLDVTELNITRKKLKKTQEKYERINEVTKDAIYEWNCISDDIIWGTGITKTLGYNNLSRNEWESKLHPAEKEIILKSLTNFLKDPQQLTWKCEYRIKKLNGDWISVEDIGLVERTNYGIPSTMIGVIRDNTSNNALEEGLKSLSKISKLGVFEEYPLEEKRTWSQIAMDIYGFQNHLEITWNKVMKTVLPEWRKVLEQKFESLSQKVNNIDIEYPIISLKGEEKWVRLIAQSETTSNDRLRINGSFQDITDKKNIEVRLQNLADNVPGVMYQYRKGVSGEEDLSLISNKAEEIWGYTAEEALVNPDLIWEGAKKGGDYEMLKSAIEESATSLTPVNVKFRYVHPEGHIAWHEIHGQPNRSSDGSTVWNCIVLDISSEYQAKIIAESAQRISQFGVWELCNIGQSDQSLILDDTVYGLLETNQTKISPAKILSLIENGDRAILLSKINTSMQTGEVKKFDFSFTSFQDRTRYCRITIQADLEKGECVKLYGSAQDITDIKTAENELKKQKEFIGTLTYLSNVLLQATDMNEAINICLEFSGNRVNADRVYYFENHIEQETGDLLCSQRYEWLKDHTSSQINNSELQNIPYDSIEYISASLLQNLPFKAITDELPEGFTKELLASQDIRSVMIIPIFAETKFVGFIGCDNCTMNYAWSYDDEYFIRNVGDRLYTSIEKMDREQTLRRTLQEKDEILSNIFDGFLFTDSDFTILKVNPSALNILNIDQSKLIGHNILEILNDQSATQLLNQVNSRKEQKIISSNTYLPRIDKYIDVNIQISKDGYSIFFRDITNSKKFEENLKISEEKYRILVENSDSIIMMTDLQGKFRFVNGKGARSIGLLPDLLIGTHYGDHFTEQETREFMSDLQEIVRNKKPVSRESKVVLLDKPMWFLSTGLPLIDNNNEIYAALFTISDITNQKLAEEQLKEDQEKYRFLFQESPYALMMIEDMKIIESNNTALELFGYERDEIINESPALLSSGTQLDINLSRQAYIEHINSANLNGNATFDWVCVKKDGTQFISVITLNKTKFRGKDSLFALIRDKTDIVEAESEIQKFREISDQANYGTAIVSNGSIQYCNESFARLHGFSISEVIGQSLFDTQTEHDETYKDLENIINETGQLTNHEILRTRKDGSTFPALVNLKMIDTALGENFWSISLIDITDRKRIEQENMQLSLAIEQSPTAMAVSNIDGYISYSSPAFTKITGYDQKEILGKKISFLDSGKNPEGIYEKMWETITKGEIWQGKVHNLRKDDSDLWTMMTISPILNADGTVMNYLALMQDVSEEQKYETSLKSLNQNLEKQAQELELSNKELEQFAYVASHDLQEPLRMISSFMGRLESKYSEALDEKAKQYIYYAVDGANRMKRIIMDLLDYSRVGRMEQELEDININSVVEEVVSLHQKIIEEKNACIQFEGLPTITSYLSPVRQVFQNLISNALKYNKPNVPPLITVTYSDLEHHWQFEVGDNGVGFEKEYYEKIFIIFQRIHNTQETPGTGVGLAVVKKHIQNLHGDITVESTPGKGTTFTFTIKKPTT